jgi:hypothetical protein
MANGVSLQRLIEQVKDELLSGAPAYPLFFIDTIELELAVTITAEGKGGINIQVLELGSGVSSVRGNIIKVTMSPILTRDEQRKLLEKDTRMLEGVERATLAALRKGGETPLVGESE